MFDALKSAYFYLKEYFIFTLLHNLNQIVEMAISFVVVYLIRAREFIIIPETWVQDLSPAKLKNNGKNSNQNFLVFWSAIDGEPNLQHLVNFNANLDSTYHSTVDEVCYLGRIKKFFGKKLKKIFYIRSSDCFKINCY